VTLTGKEFTQALQQGDQSAFEQVFFTFYKRLHAYAFLVLKDSSVQAYLYAIVYHECLRQKRRRPLLPLMDKLGTANASDKVEHAELQEHLTQAMAALSEKCRLVFYLNRVENMKYREVAAYLGLIFV